MTEEGCVVVIVESPVRELRAGVCSLERLHGCPEVGVEGIVERRGGGVGLIVGVAGGHRTSGGGAMARSVSALLGIVDVRCASRDVDSGGGRIVLRYRGPLRGNLSC